MGRAGFQIDGLSPAQGGGRMAYHDDVAAPDDFGADGVRGHIDRASDLQEFVQGHGGDAAATEGPQRRLHQGPVGRRQQLLDLPRWPSWSTS